MGFQGEIWQVRSGDDRVGEILIDDADFPWLSGGFTPGPAYDDTLRDLFACELELVERLAERDEDALVDAWEKVYDEIRGRVSLCSPDGPVPEFLLHIEDGHGSGGATSRSRNSRSPRPDPSGRPAQDRRSSASASARISVTRRPNAASHG